MRAKLECKTEQRATLLRMMLTGCDSNSDIFYTVHLWAFTEVWVMHIHHNVLD